MLVEDPYKLMLSTEFEVDEYLSRNGTMEPKIMFDTPFTLINDQGIFDEHESKKVIELVRHVNENADVKQRAEN